jgi:hypothetical protein
MGSTVDGWRFGREPCLRPIPDDERLRSFQGSWVRGYPPVPFSNPLEDESVLDQEAHLLPLHETRSTRRLEMAPHVDRRGPAAWTRSKREEQGRESRQRVDERRWRRRAARWRRRSMTEFVAVETAILAQSPAALRRRRESERVLGLPLTTTNAVAPRALHAPRANRISIPSRERRSPGSTSNATSTVSTGTASRCHWRL